MADAGLAQTRHALSPTRRDEGRVRVFALSIGPGPFSPPQPPGWAQLVSTRSGAMILHSERTAITITADVAVSVPAGVAYALDIRTQSDVRVVFTRTTLPHAQRFGPLAMTPLLRESVERAVSLGYLDQHDERHAHIVAVIEDELAHLATSAAALLRMPSSVQLRNAIECCLCASEERANIAAIAATANVSLRTFQRRFVAETGLTPREWLRRARLARATMLLATGSTVTEAGLAIGYASTSAFISAYRAFYNVTPGSRAAL